LASAAEGTAVRVKGLLLAASAVPASSASPVATSMMMIFPLTVFPHFTAHYRSGAGLAGVGSGLAVASGAAGLADGAAALADGWKDSSLMRVFMRRQAPGHKMSQSYSVIMLAFI
jgi:hypothetical protein